MVYCKDCVHFKQRNTYESALCHHPEAVISIDPVYGKVSYREAEYMRKDLKLCFRGKLFEKKPEKVRFFDRLMGLFGK